MSHDEAFMRRALELAANGCGHVEPNPLVGAVVVRDGKIIGEGLHEKFGEAHAEIHALARAGDAARGATLYVTLEPCCHHGKTPPCTDAVIAAGVTRVVAAMSDPFPQVSGGGFARLRDAGIELTAGVLESEARLLNAPYLKLLATGLPYVHAKWAMSLDGKIATAAGDSKWISGPEARRAAHELRGRMDAIVVGIGTALVDDPLLTARPAGPRVALRVVLDSRGRLPPTSLLAKTAADIPVLIATTGAAPAESLDALRARGCECFMLPRDADGTGIAIEPLLRELGARRFTNIIIEGGSRVLGSFLDAGAIDEVHAFIAARLIGGAGAIPAAAGAGIARVADAMPFELIELRPIGNDCLLRARRSGAVA